jgi:hypothetical protein
VLFAISDALAYGTDDIAGLADTNADLTALIADNNDGAKAHLFAAFDGFGDPTDLHNALLPFGITFLAAATVAATAATVTSAAAAAAAAALLLLLALTFSCCLERQKPMARRWRWSGCWVRSS